MTLDHFDHLTQSVAHGVSRRDVSRALTIGGLSVLGLTATPFTSRARRRKAQHRSKGKQDPNRLCKRQTARCQAFIAEKCLLPPGDETCREFATCCSRFESCQLAEFIACMEEGGFAFPVFT